MNGIPVSLVPNTPGGSDETLTAILVETPAPYSAKRTYQANSIIEEDEDEDNSSGSGNESSKDKLVKEGAYLKSRLWWFGLLLIATGEGGESICEPHAAEADGCRQLLVVWFRTCQCGSSAGDCGESFRSFDYLSLLIKRR